MGSWFSSSEASESTNTGVQQSSTNVINIEESVEVHNNIIIILLSIITAVIIMQFLVKAITMYRKNLKKQYHNQFHLNHLLQVPAPPAANPA